MAWPRKGKVARLAKELYLDSGSPEVALHYSILAGDVETVARLVTSSRSQAVALARQLGLLEG